MDEDMEENEVYTFTAVEIDLDYEFDAVRYFDFCREESLAEAREAELWFDSATSCPPSPFVARFFTGNSAFLENVNTSSKAKHEEVLESDSHIGVDEVISALDQDGGGQEFSIRGNLSNWQSNNQQKFQNQQQQVPSGLMFYNHVMKDSLKAKTKSSMKPYVSRTSTLMKPTASQLAKQNQPHQMCASSFQKQLVEQSDKSSSNSCGIEIRAAKRQKLDRGHLSKVSDTKHQINFVHKEPKRDGTIVGNTMSVKLRISVPREPDLETTYRAQRIRPKTGEGTQSSTSVVRRFKALPLNKKILEAPSLPLLKRSTPRVPEFREFHLKTSERARQHTVNASVSAASCSNANKELHNRNFTTQCRDETRRCNAIDKSERTELSHKFKALPLNRKEFNFHTGKRFQHNPPLELFSKLSCKEFGNILFPEESFSSKGSKENRCNPFQQEQQVKCDMKGKLPLNGEKQMRFGSNMKKAEVGLFSGISRSLGVR